MVLYSNTLFFGDSGGKAKAINGTTNTNSYRFNWNFWVNISLDLSNVHIRGMLGVGTDAMVVLDEGVKHFSKILITVPVTGVDTAMLVIKFRTACDCFSQSEA